MTRRRQETAGLVLGCVLALSAYGAAQDTATDASLWMAGKTIVNHEIRRDRSAILPELYRKYQAPPRPPRRHPSPAQQKENPEAQPAIQPESLAVEQTTQGTLAPPTLVASFDGLGYGFNGPQGTAEGRNPSDNSLAAGSNEIVQIVNSHMAIFTKQSRRHTSTGRALFGPVITNTLFAGFGGPCEKMISGDAVVRYDQLARRWLFVLPIFRRISDDPHAPYAMCYAVSTGPDPMGSYFRYEFDRPLFPDYPRPAIWRDAYYIPTSTGDTVIQKQLCAANRSRMVHGEAADEQCVIIDGVNFLNAADIDGRRLPPDGMAEVVMAAGGTQLKEQFEDDGIYTWRYHVNWRDPGQTRLTGPEKINVAPYHYLCNGQLSRCVPQQGTDTRLDSQGDKLMQRLAYRNFGDHQSIVVTHSIDTRAGGGVRWYEFRMDAAGTPHLYQQGTYAPDGDYRWMGSMAMDRRGDIGVGYSFGSAATDPGQRFAARRADDSKGAMTLREAVLANGGAPQADTLRWEDYTTLDIDPADGCTFWYVGDYLQKGAESYSTRIGGFRLPGCAARHKHLGIF